MLYDCIVRARPSGISSMASADLLVHFWVFFITSAIAALLCLTRHLSMAGICNSITTGLAAAASQTEHKKKLSSLY